MTVLIKKRQIRSIQNANALFKDIHKYQAEECKS